MLWTKMYKSKYENKQIVDHLISVAKQLPRVAIPDLLKAIIRPTQSDFLLAVAEEGTDARPDLDEGWLFFRRSNIYKIQLK